MLFILECSLGKEVGGRRGRRERRGRRRGKRWQRRRVIRTSARDSNA